MSPRFSFISPPYINSYFRQGWAFFGPNPIINYPYAEFKCVYDNKIDKWENISSELEKSKRHYSRILISNDSDYIVDSWLEKVVYSISQEEYKLCDVGDCNFVQTKFQDNYGYRNLSRLTNNLCKSKGEGGLIGSKIKIVIQNINYFSDRKLNKNGSIDDVLELPVSEI